MKISFTDREADVMKVLWEHGPSSVRRVHRSLMQFEDLAYNTVQTLLRIMEEKGLVEHHVVPTGERVRAPARGCRALVEHPEWALARQQGAVDIEMLLH